MCTQLIEYFLATYIGYSHLGNEYFSLLKQNYINYVKVPPKKCDFDFNTTLPNTTSLLVLHQQSK